MDSGLFGGIDGMLVVGLGTRERERERDTMMVVDDDELWVGLSQDQRGFR